MNREFIELEIRLLLVKYGFRKVLEVLAKIQNVSPEEIESELKRAEERKALKQKKHIKTAVEVINDIDINDSEKANLLYSLARDYDNRTFLPQLHDVKTLLNRFGLDRKSIKSRQNAAKKVFGHLCNLSIEDILKLTDLKLLPRESDFSELAGEIMGAGKSKP